MKPHLATALRTFNSGCDRAAALRSIYEYLRATGPAALDGDDILRSAVLLTVSSFDLLVHDIYRTEVLHRLAAGREVALLRVAFNSAIAPEPLRSSVIEQGIRTENSYKSFVAPDKLAECLRHLVEEPWIKLAAKMAVPVVDCKAALRRVVDLRNRIAHEADVNPDLAGIALWPIYSEDVRVSIDFIKALGGSVTQVIDEA